MAVALLGGLRGNAEFTAQHAIICPMADEQVTDGEHAVIVHLTLSSSFGDDPERRKVWELEDRLTKIIEKAHVGEYDGNEFGGGEAVLYMYGPNADSLFATVEPLIRSLQPLTGSFAIKRYGGADDSNAREERIELA